MASEQIAHVTTVRHVTVSQLINAKRSSNVEAFFVDQQPLIKAVLVANLAFQRLIPGGLELVLDDGTGKINGTLWVNDAEEIPCPEFGYVRVVGTLDEYKAIKSIRVLGVRPVADFNEVSFHLLKAMVEKLEIKHGPPPRDIVEAAVAKASFHRSESGGPSPPRSLPVTPHRPNRAGSTVSSPLWTRSPPQTTPLRGPALTPSRPLLSSPPIVIASSLSVPLEAVDDIDAALARLEAEEALLNPIRTPSKLSSPTVKRPSNELRSPTTPMRAMSLTGEKRPPVTPKANPQRQSPFAKSMNSPRRDPFSQLSALERDIILCIQNAVPPTGPSSPSIYPKPTESPSAKRFRDEPVWEGLSVVIIAQQIRTRYKGLSMPEFLGALDHLVDAKLVRRTIDEEHYACL